MARRLGFCEGSTSEGATRVGRPAPIYWLITLHRKVLAVAGACGLPCEVRRERGRGREGGGKVGTAGGYGRRNGTGMWERVSERGRLFYGRAVTAAGRARTHSTGERVSASECMLRPLPCPPRPCSPLRSLPLAWHTAASPRPRRSRSGVATPRTKQLWLVSCKCRRRVDVACVRLGDCGCERALRVAFSSSRYGWALIGTGGRLCALPFELRKCGKWCVVCLPGDSGEKDPGSCGARRMLCDCCGMWCCGFGFVPPV